MLLSQDITTKDRIIARKIQELQQKDIQLAQKNNQISEKDRLLIQKDAEKDAVIAEALSERVTLTQVAS